MTAVLNYIRADQLQLYLQTIRPPIPPTAPPKGHHTQTSPSGYYKCPHRKQTYSAFGSFYTDKGTLFHDHYGPEIMKMTFGPDMGHYRIEDLYKVYLPCEKCGEFEFMGSIDLYENRMDFLIDLKFSKNPESGPEYAPQVSAYKMLKQEGQILDQYSKWRDEDNKIVKAISILNMSPKYPGPDFLFPREYQIKPKPDKWIIKTATEYHMAKAHGVTCYRPGKDCRWCQDNATCPKGKQQQLSIRSLYDTKKKNDLY